MRKSVTTPGGLAKWAGYILGAGLVVGFAMTVMPPPWSERGLYVWYAAVGIAALVLLAAAAAKVVQIGVRSASNDRG
jgi:hypothetical protein